jgi:hypothetical protein
VCLFSQFPHAAFGSDLRLRAVDDGHWLVHTTHTVLCTSTASERTSERARVRQKRQREKIRERKRVLLDENCRNVKTIGLSSTTQKVFIFPFGLKWSKINLQINQVSTNHISNNKIKHQNQLDKPYNQI